MIPEEKKSYLGFDLSTQKLKAVQLNSDLTEVLAHAEVKFDGDLPEFRTVGGVNTGAQRQEYYVQPGMWIKAIDLVLDRLVVQGADLNTVEALSGSAQQHGSLYWSRSGIKTLESLDSDKFLHSQIDEFAFTVPRTPIWMDGSTTKQCVEMEEAIGGREVMVELTGSRCYERFTGPQIRKIFQQRTDAYENTERISLVSSFLASIFLGKVAPIDYSDGSGMNLFDIHEKKWSSACVNSCAPDLTDKLGEPVPTETVIGNVCPFFVQRYNFNPNCRVVAFTGDNPSALAGMMVVDDWLSISLGTSDTVMMSLDDAPKLQDGHVLVHPTNPDKFMGLLCFRNGSLVRDVFKRAESNDNWELFSELLESTPRGNFGNMALHFLSQEIIPSCKGSLRWNKSNSTTKHPEGIRKFASAQAEVRALIEGQMLTRKAIASDMGFSFGERTRILATGGASVNKPILQVMSDVFNAPVYVQKSAEAALYGGAFRAKFAVKRSTATSNGHETYVDFVQDLIPHHMQRICDPSPDSEAIYSKMLARYHEMIAVMTRNNQHN